MITQLEETIIKLEESNFDLDRELKSKENDIKILTESKYKYKNKKDHLKKIVKHKDEQISELKRQVTDISRNNQNELYIS